MPLSIYLAFSELEMDSSAWLELPERACINHAPKLKSAACINMRRNLEAKNYDDILALTLEASFHLAHLRSHTALKWTDLQVLFKLCTLG